MQISQKECPQTVVMVFAIKFKQIEQMKSSSVCFKFISFLYSFCL